MWHLTPVSCVGLRPTRATYEKSQVLLAGVPDGFSWGSPNFTPLTDWPISYELKGTHNLKKKVNNHFAFCSPNENIHLANKNFCHIFMVSMNTKC